MGTCCSAHNGAIIPDNEEVIDTGLGQDDLQLSPSKSTTATPSTAKYLQHDYYRKLEKGVEVMVIPVARTGILCQLRYDAKFKRFILSKDTNSRQIQLSTLRRVMHTKQDLQRVENQAGMADDENCCALLLKTHSCIGLRFASKAEKLAFIEVTEDLIAYAGT